MLPSTDFIMAEDDEGVAGGSNINKRSMPTPSPLRRMADPTAHHVMPSRKEREERSRAMLPPPAKRPKKGRPEALDEDVFVEAMGEIIERDFFPDLPKLQRQIKWLEGLESQRLASVTEVRRVVQSQVRRSDGGGMMTPLQGGGRGGAAAGSSTPLSSVGGGGDEGGGIVEQALPLSLDQFLSRYQSEDDAAFDVLAEKMREAHRRKYWWVYSHPAIESGKEPLYLLSNGEFMTQEQRLKHIEASDAKPKRGNDRPNAPETWNYRPQNALLFPAELEQTMQVHHKANAPLLLENGGGVGGLSTTLAITAGGGGGGGGSSAIIVSSSNARVGEAAKAPKEVVHSNTRFTTSFRKEAGLMPSPLERPASDISSFSTDTSASTDQRLANQGFVPMTPLIIPGAGGDVPIMTWGEVDSTPLRVSEPFEAAEDNLRSRGFKIQEPTHREKVAGRLESTTRSKGGGAAAKKVYAGSGGGSKKGTPLLTSGGAQGKKRGLASLTPQAQSLAAKLAPQFAGGGKGGGAESVFGGGASELRASYKKLSMIRPSTGSRMGDGGGGITTPSPSPMRNKKAGLTGDNSSSTSKSSGNKSSSVTENLLVG